MVGELETNERDFMKLILIAAILFMIAGCASKPNFQMNCEAQGGPLFKCEPCPWYQECSRLR